MKVHRVHNNKCTASLEVRVSLDEILMKFHNMKFHLHQKTLKFHGPSPNLMFFHLLLAGRQLIGELTPFLFERFKLENAL